MTHPIIDVAVHPTVADDEDLRDFLDEPWRHRVFAPIDRYFYPVPGAQYHRETRPRQGLPGSDPDLLSHQLLEEAKVDIAILRPLTRGLNLDVDVNSAVCEATNRWLAETWLDERNAHGRFKGTIRVNPATPIAQSRRSNGGRPISTWCRSVSRWPRQCTTATDRSSGSRKVRHGTSCPSRCTSTLVRARSSRAHRSATSAFSPAPPGRMLTWATPISPMMRTVV
jgi:hypothetical protein